MPSRTARQNAAATVRGPLPAAPNGRAWAAAGVCAPGGGVVLHRAGDRQHAPLGGSSGVDIPQSAAGSARIPESALGARAPSRLVGSDPDPPCGKHFEKDPHQICVRAACTSHRSVSTPPTAPTSTCGLHPTPSWSTAPPSASRPTPSPFQARPAHALRSFPASWPGSARRLSAAARAGCRRQRGGAGGGGAGAR